jgi:uncharacterized protein
MKNTVLKSIALAVALPATLLASSFIASAKAEPTSIWRVQKGDDVVYVGGTVHLLPASEFPLPQQFTDTYAKTDSIVLEAKLPEPTDQAAQMKMMQAFAYGDARTLQSELSPETYAALKQYFAAIGMDVAQLNGFRPGFIMSMMLVMEAQKSQMGGDGVDKYFMDLAKKDGKPSEYLESFDFQVNMLREQGVGYEDAFVNDLLEQVKEFKPVLESIIKGWRHGDTKALNELVNVKMKDMSERDYKAMLVNRNIDWVPKIEAMFGDDDKEFVLVGVGHLVGKHSVIKLLKDKGYKVTQL